MSLRCFFLFTCLSKSELSELVLFYIHNVLLAYRKCSRSTDVNHICTHVHSPYTLKRYIMIAMLSSADKFHSPDWTGFRQASDFPAR